MNDRSRIDADVHLYSSHPKESTAGGKKTSSLEETLYENLALNIHHSELEPVALGIHSRAVLNAAVIHVDILFIFFNAKLRYIFYMLSRLFRKIAKCGGMAAARKTPRKKLLLNIESAKRWFSLFRLQLRYRKLRSTFGLRKTVFDLTVSQIFRSTPALYYHL